MENQEYDIGIVEKIIDNKTAIVNITSKGECNNCISKDNCNIFSKKGTSSIEVSYSGELKIGEKIGIVVEPGFKVLSSILIFLLPLFVLFLFYIFTIKITHNELIAIAVSILGICTTYFIMYIITKKSKKLSNLKPKAIRLDF